MIRVVETKAAHNTDLWPREGREELLHCENGLGDLRGRVERRARDFVGLDGLTLGICQTNCNDRVEYTVSNAAHNGGTYYPA